MSGDNWLNLFLVIVAVTLVMKLYHEWRVADQEERTVIKVLSVIGMIVWVADMVLSYIG